MTARSYLAVPLLLFLMVISFSAGCARLSSSVTPGTDIYSFKNYYIIEHDVDESRIDMSIKDDLAARGFHASIGPQASIPADADVIVTYEDQWMWDITMYLLRLTITLRDAKTSVLLATGESYRPSLERKDPPSMVKEVMDVIFKKGG